MNETYLIWSNEHAGWWKGNRHGYASGLAGAGHFSRDEAIEICRDALMSSAHIGMIAEIPVRLADVAAITKDRHVPAAVQVGKAPWTND
jgi:hypothetical protein